MNKVIDTVLPKNSAQNVSQPHESQLSAEEITFSRLVAQGYTLTQAYKKSFPAKSKLKPDTIRTNATRLYAKDSIALEVASTKETNSQLARLSEDRIYEILTEDNIGYKGSRVADVAMFMYDHANGKSTQRIDMKSSVVSLSVSLSDITRGSSTTQS